MKKTFLLLFFLSMAIAAFPQKYTVSGYVEDSQTGERLIGCIVRDANNSKYVTTTNNFGFFSLKMPAGKVKLQVMYIGYKNYEHEYELTQDTNVTIQLQLENEIEKVVVTSDVKDVQNSQMSKIEVPVQKISKLPVIFGEVDLLKTLQLMPGVQSGTEGTSGIYVRGGGPGQNLILLDGVPVYNVSHMFGFFSVFNTNAIKNVTLYKGGFPAHFGGRLSSVIDVRMKDGNMKKLTGSVSIGAISSKFTLEGPIKKDKTSFIISARRTYVDLLAKPFIKIFGHTSYDNNTEESFDGGYYFYDFNAKLTHKLTDKDRLFLSFYSGQDYAYLKMQGEYNTGLYPESENNNIHFGWGNTIGAFRWNHAFKKNLFVNNTLTVSRFNFGVGANYEDKYKDNNETYFEKYDANYNSGIDDIAFSSDFDYIPNVNHKIKFGGMAILHRFRPGITDFSYEITQENIKFDTTFGSGNLFAHEYALYFEDDFNATKWLKFNFGARLSVFDVRDTTYIHPEPRISARVLLNKNLSVKFSYAEMMQYLHFLTNNTVGLPVDLWMPATNLTIPEQSWQAATGISWLIKDKYSLTLEGFYKRMNNVIEFREGESIFSTPVGGGMGEVWEQKITQGTGIAYGAEFMLRKTTGKLTGWIGYTYGHSDRTFPEINYGKTFPFKYDIRHNISIVGMYELNKHINFGLTWVYASGRPVTIAKGDFISLYAPHSYDIYDGTSYFDGYPYYGNRNNYRLPAYHRLDLSVNFVKEKKTGTRTWSFGIYNAYNHINPFFYYLQQDYLDNTPKTYLKIVSIFQMMPSISYSFVWK